MIILLFRLVILLRLDVVLDPYRSMCILMNTQSDDSGIKYLIRFERIVASDLDPALFVMLFLLLLLLLLLVDYYYNVLLLLCLRTVHVLAIQY